jgi:NodT family efflux transporter outer membrane factor (OMF) lipoprotein
MSACLLLAGCAVGPDFHEPSAPSTASYIAASDKGIGGAVPGGTWWTAFGSPAVDRAVAKALAANADLAAARAALTVASEQAKAQRGLFWPALGLDLNLDRQHTADALSPNLNSGQNPYTLRTGQVQIGYAPDIFGGNRRAVESATAAAETQSWELAAARASLVTNLITALVSEAAYAGEVHDLEQAIALQQEILDLTHRQQSLGAASVATVVQQEAALAQQQAALPPLQKERAQNRDAIAALLGGYPATESVPALDLAALTIPASPGALPSSLTRNRPDIRAAAAALHTASANVGIATAAQWPQLTLTGSLGRTTDGTGGLLASSGRFWDMTADLAQPLLQGGALLHRRRAAEAAYEQALAQYRSTVIGAFQNVADVLQALDADEASLKAADALNQSAKRSADLVSRQVAEGDVPRLQLLQAQTTALMAHAALLAAESARIADVIALYQALGGGWDTTPH